jgi:hypothetical protein
MSLSVTDSRLSAAPVTAPVPIAAGVPSEEGTSAAPAARVDVEPIPASTSTQIGAQSASGTESPATAESGPTSESATAGIHSVSSRRLSREELAARADAGHSVVGTDGVLMIVGGAGFIAGLIIGGGAGTAIAIAGAVIALYGLYLYLR